MRNTILQGNALSVLSTMPSESVQMCVTSPPYYGLRDYQVDGQIGLESNPGAYITALVEVFREVRRVLRPDGTLFLNLGDSYANDEKWGGSTGGKHVQALHGDTATRHRRSTGLKPKDLMMIPARVAIALQEDGWYLRSDIIWHKVNCLSGGAIVYARTQKGDMPMTVKDMVRLKPETVQLWNGDKWSQCVAWTRNERPNNPIELELRNGQRIGCTPEHLWPTQHGNVRADALVIGDIIQTCQLSEPQQPIAPAMLPDEIGWFVGMYLAEGSRSGDCIQIAGHTKEIERYERLCQIAESYGGTCRKHTDGNKTSVNLHGKILNAIIDTYISGHDAQDKHLSVCCWKRSNAFLQTVLEGYLAGDGHYDEANKRWRIGFTRNYSLENDLRALCARIGASLRLKPVVNTNTSTGKEHPSFKGEIRFTKSIHHNNKEAGEIIRIGRSRARQFWDITVADEPHLFALASGVLTHNCMPESVTDRPTNAHEHIFLLAKSERYFYDADSIREPAVKGSANAGMRNYRPYAVGGRLAAGQTEQEASDGRNKRNVWSVASQPYPESHFATFPPKLIEPCILAGSRPGDIVLDCFMGAGTTALVALQHGRNYLGIELNPAYIALAEKRIACVQPHLWESEAVS